MTMKDRAIEILKIEQECIIRADKKKCNRHCDKCDLVQDTKEILEIYEYIIRVLQCSSMEQTINIVNKNVELTVKLKKEQKKKRKWKCRAKIYKTGADNLRAIVKTIKITKQEQKGDK